MHEATFRIDGEGTCARATRGTDLQVDLWCNDHSDLLRVRGSDPGAVLDSVRSVAGISDSVGEDEERVAITADCLADHERAVDPHLARHGCLLVPPLSYADGAKLVRVLALDPGALTGAYRDLREAFAVTVESKREVHTVESDPLGPSPDLTPRQRQVLRIAREEGYYEIPRGTTTEAIGDRVGIDRRTAEEHLRRAEKKVIETVAGGF